MSLFFEWIFVCLVSMLCKIVSWPSAAYGGAPKLNIRSSILADQSTSRLEQRDVPIAFSFFACLEPSKCNFICGCDVTDMLQIWQYLSWSVSTVDVVVVVIVVGGVVSSGFERNDSPILKRPVASGVTLVCLNVLRNDINLNAKIETKIVHSDPFSITAIVTGSVRIGATSEGPVTKFLWNQKSKYKRGVVVAWVLTTGKCDTVSSILPIVQTEATVF